MSIRRTAQASSNVVTSISTAYIGEEQISSAHTASQRCLYSNTMWQSRQQRLQGRCTFASSASRAACTAVPAVIASVSVSSCSKTVS